MNRALTASERPFLWLCAPLGTALLLLTAASASAQELFKILGPAPFDSVAERSIAPGEVLEPQAEWFIEPDLDRLRQFPAEIAVETPDGARHVATRLQEIDRGNGNLFWGGRIEGVDLEGASVTLTLHEGHLVGRVTTPENTYRIEPRPDGLRLMETRPTAAACRHAVVPDFDDSDDGPRLAAAAGHVHPHDSVVHAVDGVTHRAGATLDFVALYTTGAVSRLGSVSAAEATIVNSVDFANTVFSNSSIDAMLRLVGMSQIEDLANFENGAGALLGEFRQNATAMSRRAATGADLVHLYAGRNELVGACGIAYLLSRGVGPGSMSPYAYGISSVSRCNVDDVVIHEVGHNLGANHDPSSAGVTPEEAYYPDSFGHSDFNARFDTIMVYGSQETAPYFSSPNDTYKGAPTGTAGERDNARTLRDTVHVGAQYGNHVSGGGGGGGGGGGVDPIPTPTDLTATRTSSTEIALTWTGIPDGTTVSIEARSPVTLEWTTLAEVDGSAGATITGLVADTPYTFRAVASKDGEESDYSETVSATTVSTTATCRDGDAYLCLLEERFEVSVQWRDPQSDNNGVGTAASIPSGDKTGTFWFFSPTNVELVVKTLNGTSLNDAYWVFYGALSDVEYWITVRDTEDGIEKTYWNAPKEVCGRNDTSAFPVADKRRASIQDNGTFIPMVGAELSLEQLATAPASRVDRGTAGCTAGDTVLCLQEGRIKVEVEYDNTGRKEGDIGPGRVLDELTTKDTGFFWFFQEVNLELAVKVLDARNINGNFWVFYGALSDVAYEITVTDAETGATAVYGNLQGNICGKIDVNAL